MVPVLPITQRVIFLYLLIEGIQDFYSFKTAYKMLRDTTGWKCSATGFSRRVLNLGASPQLEYWSDGLGAAFSRDFVSVARVRF